VLTVEMLPAEHGDCLWVEYGDPGRPSVLLIDGGTGAAATTRRLGRRIADRLGHDHPAALAVVTHVDADHITGVLDLLEAPGRDLPFAEVWFNGWEHLAPGVRGPVQGERLGDALRRR
jgi:glyoxylase-like metal-dependent hydrolase (beta-lactamase superfamily II)